MYKVKRYKSIYRTKRHHQKSSLSVILIIVACALFIFVGWSIAGPVQKFFSGNLKPVQTASSKANVNSKKTSSGKSASSAPAVNTNAVKGIYLPKTYLSDDNALSAAVTSAKNSGFNYAVIDLKSENGFLNYASKVQQAVSSSLIAPNAPDAAKAASKLKAAGITPAARIFCFKDPEAPKTMRDAAVAYGKSTGTLWLDGYGNRWLNPYSDKAQQYIIDIAKEAVSMGYKNIILDGVEFPSAGSPDRTANFGSTNNVSKQQALRNFVAKATQQIHAAGGQVSVSLPGMAAIGQIDTKTGQDQSIFGYGADTVTPNLCPSNFYKSGIQIGTKTITNPDATPGDTVAAVAQYLKQSNADSLSKSVPFIQAYNGSNKSYTSSDIISEISALRNAGISSYILYNPNGSYDFNSFK